MKTLILMRHAKSSWDMPDLDDRQRTLNARGRKDAPKMGQWIAEHTRPDLVLCSSAERTRETLELSGIDASIEYQDRLYHAGAGVILRQVQNTDDTISNLMILAHNPGIGHAAYLLLYAAPTDDRFDRYPTGSAAILDFDVDHWKNVEFATGKLRAFINPKRLKAQEEA